MKTIILQVSSILLFVCSIIGSVFAQSKATAKRPNIIVILADDLGYSDLGCYGGEINTPNLDWLASQGIRSTSFYNASRCCPTRASLLTGLYPHTAGIGNMTTDQKAPGYRGQLTPNTVTIAQVLKDAGYQTGMVGKWHVSETKPFPDNEQQLQWLDHQIQDKAFSDTLSYPTHKGFQKYYGNIWGVVDFFDPFSLVNGTTPVKNVPADFYYTNVLGDSAVAYIDYFTKNEDPFFMYVAFTAPHWPLQALEKDIQKYEDTYKKGWEHIRTQRYQKMIELGVINPKQVPLSDFMRDGKTWENNPDSIWDARAMAVHAAMVDCLDQNVGKLIDQLKKSGELENTFIMFLSDNGASPERPEAFGPGYDRSGTTRNGEKVSFSVNKDVLPGSQKTHMGIGQQWANAINTPFRYWKAKEHEGGINTPFIAYWPQGINSINKFNRVPAHIIDLMATCIEVSGASYPQTFDGNTITPSPGKSLIPVLNGKITKQLHDELFWEHNGAAALRQGDWKIVRLGGKADWELYNLAVDRTEINNLAKKFPNKVDQMQEKWQQLANQYQVFPKPVTR
ncbi:arylsulfatase [Sphingobacterium corticibacterium]|uniref:Arylsulfatase n=1 Tax=Sphingobacterium corticibacterium TaxID=2484746 RepID=A0A4Q6XS73_9SPHI|nr:arylsulfatase [Sphingobacterium corticibacterium]RZF60362.1 arylsulfatase [Sphingobacterium corticibacterium]